MADTGSTDSTTKPVRATLTKVKSGKVSTDQADIIPVHFNPVSLQYSIENTRSDQGGQGGSQDQTNKKTQYTTQSKGKLTMDLVFDTTHNGDNVRGYTQKVAKLMDPSAGENNSPPVFQFGWGLYTFTGLLDSYKETIDFFSADGVPLRATVNITMSSQTDIFNDVDPTKGKTASVVPTPDFGSATDAATQGGDPNAGRSLASSNNLDSLRFTAGATLSVDPSVQLKPPVAFTTASAGAGLGIGAGAGLSIGGGISVGGGISAGGGISVGGGISAGAGASFGGSASAGVSATAGAFAGLRVQTTTSTQANLDVASMQRVSTSITDFTTDSSATFSLGGRASMKSSDGLSAEVGTSRSLRDVIRFEE